jgi:signal transduction histidine kinase
MIKFSPKTTPENAGRMTRIGMTTLMVITHCAVAAMTISLLQAIEDWHFLIKLPVVMVAGGAFGALLTYGVLNDLERVETALYRLGQGLRVELLPTKHREPMRFMMEHVNTLIERERELAVLRQQLSGQIGEAAAQEERSRLARDLHDSIKQQIFSISVSAAAAQARWEHDTPGAQKAMADVRQSAQEAMVEMRAMLQQLAPAPLEKVGLIQALRDQCEALEYRTGATVTCEISDLPPDDRLPPGAQEAIFRIAQEALTNIARHARASQVRLRLSADDAGATLSIADDGQGFERAAATKGMGLANMVARAQSVDAQLNLDSDVGKGARLTMSVPYVKPMITVETPQQTTLSAAAEKYFADAKRRLQLTAPAMFIALTMLFVFALAIGRENNEGWEMTLGMAVGGVGTIVSFLSGRALLRGMRDMRALRDEVGNDAPEMLVARYNLWLGMCLLPLFLFIFVPEAVIIQFGSDTAVLVGTLGFAGAILTFVRAFHYYRRYVQGLSLSALRDAARDDFPESTWSRYSWVWALPMLMNLLFNFPLQIPPLDRGDWLDVSLPLSGVLFLAASFVNWRYHRNINRHIEAREVA